MSTKNLDTEKIGWKANWTIYNWGQDSNDEIASFLQSGGSIQQAIGTFEVTPKIETIQNNLALNEGLQELIDIICGENVELKAKQQDKA